MIATFMAWKPDQNRSDDLRVLETYNRTLELACVQVFDGVFNLRVFLLTFV